MELSEETVAPYITVRILLGPRMHVIEAERSVVFWS